MTDSIPQGNCSICDGTGSMSDGTRCPHLDRVASKDGLPARLRQRREPLLTRAADEIERLRAKMADTCNWPNGKCCLLAGRDNPETTQNDAPTVRPAVIQVAELDRSNGPSVNEGAIPSGAATYMGMNEQKFREWEDLYTPCKAEVANWKAITISHCRRIHRLGYNRAARIMEALEAFGVLKRDRATGAFSVNQGSNDASR